jgi:hypothetical protein
VVAWRMPTAPRKYGPATKCILFQMLHELINQFRAARSLSRPSDPTRLIKKSRVLQLAIERPIHCQLDVKVWLLGLVDHVACGSITLIVAAPGGHTPDIVLVLADDVGYSDLGFNGNNVVASGQEVERCGCAGACHESLLPPLTTTHTSPPPVVPLVFVHSSIPADPQLKTYTPALDALAKSGRVPLLAVRQVVCLGLVLVSGPCMRFH